MPWTVPIVTLDDGPLAGGERAVLQSFLAGQRSMLLVKCAGLTGGQLAERTVPPSALSLLGLLRHLAKVERTWFRERVAGEPVEPMYDPALGRDADFEDLDPARAEADHARLVTEWRLADAAAATRSLDDTITVGGDVISVRSVYVHVIEEYAQHNGHADLIRERLDGITGY